MRHKVFISWSGEDSRAVADALADWLPSVLPYVKPWISTADIKAGARWLDEITKALEAAPFGIICATKENVINPWILFEAGALGKTLQSAVCPYLLNLGPGQLPAPLSQFQAKRANKEGTRALVHSINDRLDDDRLPDQRLERIFERWWPDLESDLGKALGRAQERAAERLRLIEDPNDRTRDIIEELTALESTRTADASAKIVRFSGFLSAFAISEKEPYDDHKRHEALLEEKECLLRLARGGYLIRCIVTPPPNPGFIRGDQERAGMRVDTLIEFLQSKDQPHKNIEWTVSPYVQKSLYVIGSRCSFEGFKSGLVPGYDLTLRCSAQDAISGTTDCFDKLFDHLRFDTIQKYGKDSQGDPRERLRQALLNCLKESRKALKAPASQSSRKSPK